MSDPKAVGRALIREHALIAGEAIPVKGEGIAVDDPATGEIIGHVPDLGAAETERAVKAAHDAFADWSRSDPHARSLSLRFTAPSILRCSPLARTSPCVSVSCSRM